jgi:basic membrane lipoprotein Med (substrate-binding protein (PBP1-ABC) superfamily)
MLGGAVMWLLGPTAGSQAADAKRKMAMILPGSIQDADFNTVGHLALQEVAKIHGLEVSKSESVAIADAERVSREYLTAGYDIIAYHGGTYIPIMKKLAPLFPKAGFIQETSGRLPDAPANAWILGRKFYRGFYALGAVGALSTKTNKVGFIGGVATPDVITSLNAVYQAIKEYNPRVQLIYNNIGDYNDPVKARQTAETQIAGGVDFIVVYVNLGLYGIIEAAKAASKPILVTTFYTEKRDLAPKHLSVSLTTQFATPYTEIVGRILKGERTGYYEMSPGSGMDLSDIRNVPPEVVAKVKAIFKEVVAGKAIPEIGDKIVVP